MEHRLEEWQYQQRLALPLEIKIRLSQERIRAWYEYHNGEVFVSFSGGLDSTVLLHLVRQSYPKIKGVFADALSYPEIIEHVKATDGVVIVRPQMPFNQVVKHYGYPVLSKRLAQYIGNVQRAKGETATKRLRLTGIKSDGTFSRMSMIPKKWQYLCDAPFKIDDRCCLALKKRPLRQAQKEYGAPMMGVRIGESNQRLLNYKQHGCNAFNLSEPRSWPIAFWTSDDIREYIRQFNVPYSSVYDMGYTRTGCFACMFGVHMEKPPNRFQLMQVTHPGLWKYCVKVGIPEVLDYIGVSYDPALL